ncbi:MAG: peptide ABC transporter permease [Rhizobiales bacterium 65-9]|nr:ABC transporter permease [Hyphomicrobiales bacterium]OJY38424.1 MAG: peptide ABC transporter permease [Rhizobiales bacterium 65-9]
MTAAYDVAGVAEAGAPQKTKSGRSLWSSPVVVACLAILAIFLVIAILAPHVVGDYMTINTRQRLRPPGAEFWFGTDHLGRDIFARVMVGTRNSLIVGATIAAATTAFGVLIGLYAGYFRLGDRIIMRVMDGLMAIPGVLLAVALVSILGGGLATVVAAIAIPEIPRMARLARSVTLSLKEQAFVDATVSIGASTSKILFRHILPNAVGPLTVQATYVCASAIITESILSFLGVGTPPEIPSWGNIIALGRQYFQIAPWIIFFPGLCLSILILAINLLGDSLRDELDPRLARSSGLR